MAPVATPTFRTGDEILDELATIRRELDEHARAVDRLYERRVDLFREARAIERKGEDGPGQVLQRLLADASGVSEVMVITAIKKAEQAER